MAKVGAAMVTPAAIAWATRGAERMVVPCIPPTRISQASSRLPAAVVKRPGAPDLLATVIDACRRAVPMLPAEEKAPRVSRVS